VAGTQTANAEGNGFVLSTGNENTVFETSNLKWGEDELGTSSETITWSLSLAGLRFNALFSREQFEAAAQAAFNAWEAAADVIFEFVDSSEADIKVVTADSSQVGALSGSVVGLANYGFSEGPDRNNDLAIINNATIYMDLDPTWSPAGENSDLSYFAVLAHEIGHALGLAHVSDADQIMNTPISTNELGDGDIAGARLLYGIPLFSNGDDDENLLTEAAGLTLKLRDGNDMVTATNFGDLIFGGAGDDTVFGADGADVISDALGENTLNGDDGDDLIFGGGVETTANGGNGSDIIVGGSGHDFLSGGIGDDTIVGDTINGFFHGDDEIVAGEGTDFLQGGGGADTFVFRTQENTNTIARLSIDMNDPTATDSIGIDFESGIDEIELIGFGYASQAEAFGFVNDFNGTAQFSDQGTTIIFHGLTKATLAESDFSDVFSI
jgi:Ca2+-binding RTX toxin-like protein